MNKVDRLFSQISNDAVMVINPSNIFYFADYLADYCYLLLTKSKGYYFTDGRFIIEAKRDLSDYFEVVEITPKTAFSVISSYIDDLKINNIGYDSEISHNDFVFFDKLTNTKNKVDITHYISNIRSIKDNSEIDKIKEAQRIAEKSLEELKQYIKVGVSEKELSSRLEFILKMNGADSTSFPTIVAFGENSAICHAKPSDRLLRVGDIILIDFGAKYKGYCSDMTRTFVYSECSDEIKKIYDIVLGANMLAIDKIKAGIKAQEIDSIARDYIKSFGYESNFVHSLGHGVGVDIHEAPALSKNADSSVILEENMVVTIEPGIYVEGLGGVRIEDMIVVKNDKSINLTASNKYLEILK